MPEAGHLHRGVTRRHITIVGASLAGLRAAESLRRQDYDGPITLIGDEPHAPYDRPPLSKQFLAGDWDEDRLALTKPEKLADHDLTFRLGTRATAFDLASRRLTLDDGSDLEVDGLLIATGARCRTLPGTEDLDGVFVLRGLDDSLAIRRAFDAGPRRVVVVGAGFIGAEVAATARESGLEVTLVEALPQPLGRVLGDEMGAVCAAVHREHGVDLRVGVGVEAIEGDGRVERVRLSDGSVIDADVVVVGIGVIPNTEWLEGSGLEIDNGVVCDATCLAAPGVTAAGDVARWPNQRFGEVMRVEHWDNAVEQGGHAARRLLQADEDAEPFTPVPWFWSDQYDRKLQLAGRIRPDDDMQIVTGSVEERRFAALYGREGRLVGVLGFNRPRHVMQYKTLIEQGVSYDEALAADL
ncbi:MAG: pyridine nucleotide-disulfide oxidoreductase [Acidimicrobiales bacterium]|nr:MAG: pyridine nucleotide-disulfide oxidoreductase [Acidimicrobiales bacterium]